MLGHDQERWHHTSGGKHVVVKATLEVSDGQPWDAGWERQWGLDAGVQRAAVSIASSPQNPLQPSLGVTRKKGGRRGI